MRISDWSSDVCSSDLIAYGFGNYESYAYLAGTNLIDFSKHIHHETGPEIFTGNESCEGRTVRFSAELDFEVYSFQWDFGDGTLTRSEEHTSELQSLMRISYAVFCLKKKKDYK